MRLLFLLLALSGCTMQDLDKLSEVERLGLVIEPINTGRANRASFDGNTIILRREQ